MRGKFVTLILCLFFGLIASAQTDTTRDASRLLEGVTIHAFEQNRQLKEVSAAVSVIDPLLLQQSANTSLVPAVNSAPGVRMEERSPGSYRINIRGSTLRSPFGVRNVKVYWNDIPFTDPGGNTYLNQLGFYNVNAIEIIKGPAGSMYGAGTGGAILLHSQPDTWAPGIGLHITGGSYNSRAINLSIKAGTEDRQNIINYTHQESDGYRLHTAMRRDIGTWQTNLKVSNRQQLNASFLYGDLYYQTPGALTLKEYSANPQAFRPAAGGFGNAEQVQAAIYQKMLLAGITNKYQFSDHWQNSTTVYGSFVQFDNPTFRTYEKRVEPQFGGRTVFTYSLQGKQTRLQLNAGAEAQRGFFNTRDFKNNQGRPDSVQTDDEIGSWIYNIFAQVNLRLPGDWDLTAGASFNQFHVSDQRLSDPSLPLQQRTYSNQLAPRLALSKKITTAAWLYASVARGFSPPAIAEVLPPSRTISTSLNAETGINYEAGVKSTWLQNRLYTEVNLFYFRLQDAIVQRQQVNAANYYVNAGTTRQKGIEAQLRYAIFPAGQSFFRPSFLYASYTYNDFYYGDFKQGNTDFSGNQLPSVPRNSVSAGLNLATRMGIYVNLNYYYSDKLALNDANTDYAGSYQLLGAKVGYAQTFSSVMVNFFAGADNLGDVRYSLGNDINAAAGRYYNAAAGRNYYGGISVQWHRPKKLSA